MTEYTNTARACGSDTLLYLTKLAEEKQLAETGNLAWVEESADPFGYHVLYPVGDYRSSGEDIVECMILMKGMDLNEPVMSKIDVPASEFEELEDVKVLLERVRGD